VVWETGAPIAWTRYAQIGIRQGDEPPNGDGLMSVVQSVKREIASTLQTQFKHPAPATAMPGFTRINGVLQGFQQDVAPYLGKGGAFVTPAVVVLAGWPEYGALTVREWVSTAIVRHRSASNPPVRMFMGTWPASIGALPRDPHMPLPDASVVQYEVACTIRSGLSVPTGAPFISSCLAQGAQFDGAVTFERFLYQEPNSGALRGITACINTNPNTPTPDLGCERFVAGPGNTFIRENAVDFRFTFFLNEAGTQMQVRGVIPSQTDANAMRFYNEELWIREDPRLGIDEIP